jgi:RNA polymerase sigma-B factor
LDSASSPDSRGNPPDAELFVRWRRSGDGSARAELIERHLPLARKLAARYARGGDQLEDLVQVASVGLINAVERFEPEQGFAFSTYAVPTIIGELKRHFRDTGWSIRVDRRAQERARAVTAAERALAERGRTATVEALAELLECDTEEVLEGLQAALVRSTVSLDAPAGSASPEGGQLLDTVGMSDARLEQADDRATISAAVRHLPRLERRILYLRFGEDLSQREIATLVGISQMHVSRLLRKALEHLREMIDDSPATA